MAIKNTAGCDLFSALTARATHTSIVITSAWIAMFTTLTPPPTKSCRNMSPSRTHAPSQTIILDRPCRDVRFGSKADICAALPPKADVEVKQLGRRPSRLEYAFEKLFDGPFGLFRCRSVVTDMRIKFDAWVLISKWLPCRSTNQYARRFFDDHAVANRLSISNDGGRGRTERIVKSVRRSCILGDLNVVSSSL